MNDAKKQHEKAVEQEIKSRQKFTMAGAIGRAGGGGMMKGASPIPRRDQVVNQIVAFIKENCLDASGAVKSILSRRVKNGGNIIDDNLETPEAALAGIIGTILDNDANLHEFVRQVDVRWGEMYQERPHFQQPGQEPHPDDEYTHASVAKTLNDLLAKLAPTP